MVAAAFLHRAILHQAAAGPKDVAASAHQAGPDRLPGAGAGGCEAQPV